ncbi:MAG: UDP-2,4-diacetamido-2,4,6-trideoxy-beta-L-altropyranose hydrolase [Oscillatoria sp. SIO1A7]|nr:UDP-2,4-diacetamido-2,4,6-trideoxy-beta-L-altropyranose hydrolase [Oscillatoria sp. SIO1A7]
MKLLIRADASAKIGTGHVMRCLALAQAWQGAKGEPIFAMANPVPALEKRIESEGMQVVCLTTEPGSAADARETAAVARELQASWVVVDGYRFGGEYQKTIKDSGLRLLFIDDCGHAEHYYADLVLNQNISAEEQWYRNREPCTQLLLGTRYTLLRREFWQWQGWQRTVPAIAKKVLVTLGGADPDNVTLKVIRALQLVEVEELEAVVVVGGSNPHYETLEMAVQDSRFPIRLQRNVTNMPQLMAWADVAISAGGSTCWELAFMGLPSLLLVLAENQRAIAEKLATLNQAVNLGWHQNVKAQNMADTFSTFLQCTEQRTKAIEVSQQIVDGEGVSRIVKSLEANSIQLRSVREEDCELLWHWANDPEVRDSAFYSEYINWETHVKWFESKLTSKTCFIFIVEDINNNPIGQVRFELIGNKEAEIDISIEKKNRGKGLASAIISKGILYLSKEVSIELVHSFIKVENKASIRGFEKSNFDFFEAIMVNSNLAYHYILRLLHE